MSAGNRESLPPNRIKQKILFFAINASDCDGWLIWILPSIGRNYINSLIFIGLGLGIPFDKGVLRNAICERNDGVNMKTLRIALLLISLILVSTSVAAQDRDRGIPNGITPEMGLTHQEAEARISQIDNACALLH